MDLSDLVRRTLSRRRADGTVRIVQAGHPALRDRSRAWRDQLEPELLVELVEAMTITMREAPGVGLAAPQIGIPLRLVVVEDRFAPEDADDEDDVLRRRPLPLRAFLDPSYEAAGTRRALYWEGCLSVDGWQSIVPRALAVDVRALELRRDGTLAPMAERWEGWSARIIQHETDHLDGLLCHDRAVPRSYVASLYAGRYADLSEAVERLGLTGDVARLAPGEIELDGATG